MHDTSDQNVPQNLQQHLTRVYLSPLEEKPSLPTYLPLLITQRLYSSKYANSSLFTFIVDPPHKNWVKVWGGGPLMQGIVFRLCH